MNRLNFTQEKQDQLEQLIERIAQKLQLTYCGRQVNDEYDVTYKFKRNSPREFDYVQLRMDVSNLSGEDCNVKHDDYLDAFVDQSDDPNDMSIESDGIMLQYPYDLDEICLALSE